MSVHHIIFHKLHYKDLINYFVIFSKGNLFCFCNLQPKVSVYYCLCPGYNTGHFVAISELKLCPLYLREMGPLLYTLTQQIY